MYNYNCRKQIKVFSYFPLLLLKNRGQTEKSVLCFYLIAGLLNGNLFHTRFYRVEAIMGGAAPIIKTAPLSGNFIDIVAVL